MREPQDTLDPATRDDQLVARLLEEITQRIEAGLPVDLEAYEREYPQHIERIRRAVPALQVLDDLGLSAAKGSHSAGSSDSAPLGGTLGDYRILCEIGRGGMGIVYEAEQISLHRRVALKVLPFAAVLDPRHLQRFKNEAQAAASLRHPNIVQVFSVGCERGVHYYAMDYVEGQTLAEVIGQLRGARGQGPGARDKGRGARAEGSEPRGEGPDASSSIINHQSSILPPHPVTPSPLHPLTDTSPLALLSTEGSTRSPEFFRAVARLGIQAAEALEHAHQMGVVHRDIKPSNLMVEFPLPSPARGRGAGGEGRGAESPLPSPARGRGTESPLPSPSGRGAGGEGRGGEGPRLWITDFGLARISTPSPLGGEGRGEGGRGEGASLTMTGDVLGTLRYMSPEQLQAKHGALDHRTDVYSLGLTLYELLTLQPAFPGDDRQGLIRQIAEDDPRPPRQLNKAIPTDLETIVLKATAKEPHSRYATAQQLADDLRRFVEDKPIQARRPSLAERAARWSRRHYWAVSRGIFLSVALLLMTALVIFNSQQREARQRLRAEANMAMALDALDRLYLQYAEETYLETAFVGDQVARPRPITPQAKQFLENVLEFYARFASANRDDPSVRRHTLKAFTRVGECRSRLGMYDGAETAFNAAIHVAEELVSEFPDDSVCQESLARAQAGLADVAARKGNWDQAILDFTHALRINPGDAQAYRDRGFAYSEKGELDRSIADFNEAIRLDPESVVAYVNRGCAYFDKGEYDRAIADFNEAIRLDPKSAVAYLNRGSAYGNKGEYDRAIADFNEAIRLDPESVVAYINRGEAHRLKGEVAQAIADGNEAIRLQPENALPYNLLACALLTDDPKWRRPAEALKLALKGVAIDPKSPTIWYTLGEAQYHVGDYKAVVESLGKAMQLSSGGPNDWNTLGDAQYRVGEYKAAIESLGKAMQLSSGGSPNDWLVLAMAHWQLGQKSVARRWYQRSVVWQEKNEPKNEDLRRLRAEAEALLELTAAQLHADPARAHYERARAHDEKGELSQAIAAYNEAIRLDPTSAQYHLKRGKAYASNADLEQALADFTEVIRLDASEVEAWVERAAIYVDGGQSDKATADLKEALRIDAYCGQFYVARAEAYRQTKQPERARGEYRKAIRLEPDNAAFYHNLAVALLMDDPKQPAEAVKMALRAVALDPKGYGFWRTLGTAQYRVGDYQAAVESLGKAMQLSSGGGPKNWYFLAMAHWQLGHKAEARTWYDKAAQWTQEHSPNDETLLRFRAEAEELLAIKDKPSTAKEPAGKPQ